MKKGKIGLILIFSTLIGESAFGQQGPNMVKNGSFETADSTTPTLADGWQVFGNPYSRVAPPRVWDGAYALQVTSGAGAIQHIVLDQQTSRPIRISVRVSGQNIVDDPNDNLGASLDCKVGFHDGSVTYCPTTQKTKNVGTFDWKWIGYNTYNLSPSNQTVDWIDIRLRMGAVAGTAWFDDVHLEEWTPTQNGLVTFIFDDSFASTYNKAYPLLSSYGYVGTEAAITNYLDTDQFHLTLSQLKELYAAGWSVVSHTVHHPDLTTLSLVNLNDEIYWSQNFLQSNGFNVQHIALPYGAYNGLVMARCQAELYKSVRTSDQDVNPQGVFPFNIYVMPIKSGTLPSDLSGWIQTALARRSWLVLLIHEIDNPNNAPYNVDFATLSQMVEMVSGSGLSVVTYDQGFNMMTTNASPGAVSQAK